MDLSLNSMGLLCVGYGYVAQHWICSSPIWHHVLALRRQESDPRTAALESLVHGTVMNRLSKDIEHFPITHILISSPPCDWDDDVTRMLSQKLPFLRWIGYISSTGVYETSMGEWVNEKSKLGKSPKALARLRAEKIWQDFAQKHHVPCSVFRLSGIYGPKRSVFDRPFRIIKKKGHVFNRIHVDDIAQILTKNIQHIEKSDIFNVSDDLPASQEDVVHYAAGLKSCTEIETLDSTDPDLSPAMKHFFAREIRVNNTYVKAVFNIQWKYPTYKHGIDGLLTKN